MRTTRLAGSLRTRFKVFRLDRRNSVWQRWIAKLYEKNEKNEIHKMCDKPKIQIKLQDIKLWIWMKHVVELYSIHSLLGYINVIDNYWIDLVSCYTIRIDNILKLQTSCGIERQATVLSKNSVDANISRQGQIIELLYHREINQNCL